MAGTQEDAVDASRKAKEREQSEIRAAEADLFNARSHYEHVQRMEIELPRDSEAVAIAQARLDRAKSVAAQRERDERRDAPRRERPSVQPPARPPRPPSRTPTYRPTPPRPVSRPPQPVEEDVAPEPEGIRIDVATAQPLRIVRISGGAVQVLTFAKLVLPRENRAEYSEEFLSELYDLAVSGTGLFGQTAHALRVLQRILPLRAALKTARRSGR